MVSPSKNTDQDGAAQLHALEKGLNQLAPEKRIAAMLNAPNPKQLVQATAPLDLYYAIESVGLADAAEIVQLASAEQFRTFVDLGAWKKDEIDPSEALKWFDVIRGSQYFRQKVRAVDLELLEYLLRRFTIIHDLEANPDAAPRGPALETPEGKYLIEFTAHGVELQVIRSILTELLSEDPFGTVRLLEAVRWEVPAELCEAAYQFRAARLQDLGFLPFDSAISLFSYLPPQNRVQLGPVAGANHSNGKTDALSSGNQDFLRRGLELLSNEERENVDDEIRILASAVLVAEGADPGDLGATRNTAEMTRDYLALGLEEITAGDLNAAGEAIREVPLRKIFQIGFSLTLELKFQADRLARQPSARQEDGSYLLFSEEAAAINALRRKRPLRALKVDGAEPVTFRWRRELRETQNLLARAENQLLFLSRILDNHRIQALSDDDRVLMKGATVERLFATVVANCLLDGELQLRPVGEGRLVELCERLVQESSPVVRQSALDRVYEILSRGVPTSAQRELRRLVRVALERLAQEIGAPYVEHRTVDAQLASIALVVHNSSKNSSL